MNVKFVSITPDAEKTMAYIARVSNPSNQENEKYAGLLKYCIKHNHWSVFEQSSMTLEIETTRGLAAQILRHRSFTYQEFSQRYADSTQLGHIPLPALRRQDEKNRQNSTDDLAAPLKTKYYVKMMSHFEQATELYNEMLKKRLKREKKQHEREVSERDSRGREDDGVRSTGEQPKEPRQSKRQWFIKLLHKARALVRL